MRAAPPDTEMYQIGTSGWQYGGWRGRYYPADLPSARWLEYYAASFATVEINSTFYHLPREKAVAGWRERAPANFTFALKASRQITHYRRLKGTDEPLRTFLSRARLLGPKLGPILYQLPPGLHRDDALLADFLASLPPDLPHAVEFRHASWFDDTVFDLLAKDGVAFCVISLVRFSCPVVATAPFLYLRFHGSGGKYWGSYSDGDLDRWAQQIVALAGGQKAVYAYFNNDASLCEPQDHGGRFVGFPSAVADALCLRERLAGS